MLQLIERGFFKSLPIKLSDKGMPSQGNPDVQVLRIGSFNHPKYGEFVITQATLQELKTNFDSNVRGVDVAFDYFHDSDKEASGWPTELYLSEDGNELWAKVEWTPTARAKLADRELRYFSPDFAFVWEDPETGQTFKNVLFGGGLTNRPFVKDMAAIVAAEQERDAMTLTELEKKLVKLSEDQDGLKAAHADLLQKHAVLQKKLAEYEENAPAVPAKPADPNPDAASDDDDGDEDDLPTLKKKLAEAEGRSSDLEKQNTKLKEQMKMSEKETKFNVLLTEGKACAAQKKAFLEGDMEEFVKLSSHVNLESKGHGGDDKNNGGGDKEDQILKLAEAKCKADPKLDLVKAISLAQREIK